MEVGVIRPGPWVPQEGRGLTQAGISETWGPATIYQGCRRKAGAYTSPAEQEPPPPASWEPHMVPLPLPSGQVGEIVLPKGVGPPDLAAHPNFPQSPSIHFKPGSPRNPSLPLAEDFWQGSGNPLPLSSWPYSPPREEEPFHQSPLASSEIPPPLIPLSVFLVIGSRPPPQVLCHLD